MNWPQYTIITGLLMQIITILVMQYRVNQNPFVRHLPPQQQFMVRKVWTMLALPLGEAFVLYQGGFFS